MKNGESKLTMAVAGMTTARRLLLSGTPIQVRGGLGGRPGGAACLLTNEYLLSLLLPHHPLPPPTLNPKPFTQ